jgi:hypothetical protein
MTVQGLILKVGNRVTLKVVNGRYCDKCGKWVNTVYYTRWKVVLHKNYYITLRRTILTSRGTKIVKFLDIYRDNYTDNLKHKGFVIYKLNGKHTNTPSR